MFCLKHCWSSIAGAGSGRRFGSAGIAAFLAAGLVTGLTFGPAPAQPTTGSFVDDFASFSTARWYVSDGWANGDHQNCIWSKSQISLKDGVLQLFFQKRRIKDRDYACAEIQTKARFGYGTYEARLKTPAGSGLNAAFFTYIGPADKKPHDEIDFEVLTKDTSRVQLNVYRAAKGGNEKLVDIASGSDAAFNDYAFVWEKDRLRWFLNGELVHTIADPAKLPTNTQKIFLSFWGSDTLTDWMGMFQEPESGMLAMQVDRISFTAQGEACQFEGSVACALD